MPVDADVPSTEFTELALREAEIIPSDEEERAWTVDDEPASLVLELASRLAERPVVPLEAEAADRAGSDAESRFATLDADASVLPEDTEALPSAPLVGALRRGCLLEASCGGMTSPGSGALP